MTKPTGRPRGRPKTKEYVTLMARVPQDLAERVRRYAGRKRQTISDVLRDGFLVLLQEDDPHRPFTSDTNGAQGIMSDMKGDTATQDAQPSIVSDIKEEPPGHDNVSDMNTETMKASDTKEDKAGIVSDTKKAGKRKRAKRGAQPVIVSDIKEALPDNMSDTKKARARKRAKRS